jgi:hypothetical protein
MEFPFGGFINSNHILMELLFKAGKVGVSHWDSLSRSMPAEAMSAVREVDNGGKGDEGHKDE